jgi:hypothetical protein
VPALTSICNPLRTKKLQNLPILFLTGRDFNPSNFRTKLGLSVRSLAESRFRRNVCPRLLTDDSETSRWRGSSSAMDRTSSLSPYPILGSEQSHLPCLRRNRRLTGCRLQPRAPRRARGCGATRALVTQCVP